MYYTVYKITNLINNKIYIGVHKTKDINDDYMGSGKILKRAQEKYGIENFRKEILEVYDNAEDMFSMESVLVNEDFVNDKETYNLKIGGEGGWEYINNKGINMKNHDYDKMSTLGNNKLKEKRKCEIFSKTYRNKISDGMKEYYRNGGEPTRAFQGKKHSEEAKKKIGEANSKHQSGTGNSQFGTMWIYSLEEKVSKKIKKDELPSWEQEGWLKGRKIKF